MNKQRKQTFIAALIIAIISATIVIIYSFSEDRISNNKYYELIKIEEQIIETKSISPYDLVTDSISYPEAEEYLQNKEDSLKCEFSNKFALLSDSEQRAYNKINSKKEKRNEEFTQRLKSARAYINKKYE